MMGNWLVTCTLGNTKNQAIWVSNDKQSAIEFANQLAGYYNKGFVLHHSESQITWYQYINNTVAIRIIQVQNITNLDEREEALQILGGE